MDAGKTKLGREPLAQIISLRVLNLSTVGESSARKAFQELSPLVSGPATRRAGRVRYSRSGCLRGDRDPSTLDGLVTSATGSPALAQFSPSSWHSGRPSTSGNATKRPEQTPCNKPRYRGPLSTCCPHERPTPTRSGSASLISDSTTYASNCQRSNNRERRYNCQ